MPRVPAQVSALLKELTAQLPLLLGSNLVGIYLHGSLPQGGFKAGRSDIDCIVVTKRKLSDTRFGTLGASLERIARWNPGLRGCKCSFSSRMGFSG